MSGSSRIARGFGLAAAALALLAAQAAEAQAQRMDPDNPTCPLAPNWSNYPQMRFSMQQINGHPIMLAEGQIDDNLIPRLQAFLRANPEPYEVWLRSPGGNARVGTQAGRIIRTARLNTRVPAGWACFSACNFMFMGGDMRNVDPGGLFIVHMFTFTGNRDTIRSATAAGEAGTVGLIGEIEQGSAMLASEDNDFLIRMGVSRALLTEVMYRVSAVRDSRNRETRRCLTQAEINRYNVATPEFGG
jgi:hypothetical protein